MKKAILLVKCVKKMMKIVSLILLLFCFNVGAEELSYIEKKKIVKQKFYENCKELGIKCSWGGDIIYNNNNYLPPSTCEKDELHCWIKDDKGDIKGEVCNTKDEGC